ncbi:hypothetical protein LC653_29960 [Nostoc sp. CHAB 5784]|uniref:hypothetical protein n=1 Tax=Nostoc mirabile TaxID=2907820 RepID=UPI001E3354B4|nr:hypothetical protein [Nostoc mirabile]MCC5667985.1 hypothetical protein [Nostoc mirabile CHAB5784]
MYCCRVEAKKRFNADKELQKRKFELETLAMVGAIAPCHLAKRLSALARMLGHPTIALSFLQTIALQERQSH